MKNNGNMKSIREIQSIINSKHTYIPLLQRNYKWSRECAAELAEDIWNACVSGKNNYQLNMITIYKDETHDSFQIIDGQQRIITLKLFLTILNSKEDLNFSFERDEQIEQESGRQYFINNVLSEKDYIDCRDIKSVDIKRLRNNYYSMLLPLSFKTVYEAFVQRNCNKERFLESINAEIVSDCIKRCLNKDDIKQFYFNEDEKNKIVELCKKFYDKYDLNKYDSNKSNDSELSDDEIRVSDISEKFQLMWEKKISCHVGDGLKNITDRYKDRDELINYIFDKVEMLYHETTSEPIDEFLNINENKTRFVISDYIRANMISDNPVEGNDLTGDQITENKKRRKEILELFSSLSKYLYSSKDELIWDLIKTRYDDFSKHPDINRLKILFCDKYIGTSTKGYVYKEEIERLRYFNEILGALEKEIGIGDNEIPISWNTYNAVYMLLECKQTYRFFKLFTKNYIDAHTALDDITVRERKNFCFFEKAYKWAKDSEDLWDVSYFLESQIYERPCNIKKAEKLPGKKEVESEWCQVDRGEENDELYNCLDQMIQKKGGNL